MSQQHRLARGGKGKMQQRNIEDNKQKFNNLRKNHEIRGLNLKFIGNKNNPSQILTARMAQDGQSNRAEKIRKNLMHMKQQAQKKRAAQDHYYGQGRSPMLKNNNNQRRNNQQRNNQQRNNQHRNNQQRNNQQKTFKNAINNKNSVQQRLNINNKQFVPVTKQAKINRIQNFNNKRNQNNRNVQNQNRRQNTIRTVNPRTGEVKFLRPRRKTVNSKPTNFTVRVGNAIAKQENNIGFLKHHVSTELDPNIQNEIRIIQMKGPNYSVPVQQNFVTQVSNATDARVPISTTRTTLHERFSRI